MLRTPTEKVDMKKISNESRKQRDGILRMKKEMLEIKNTILTTKLFFGGLCWAHWYIRHR